MVSTHSAFSSMPVAGRVPVVAVGVWVVTVTAMTDTAAVVVGEAGAGAGFAVSRFIPLMRRKITKAMIRKLMMLVRNKP